MLANYAISLKFYHYRHILDETLVGYGAEHYYCDHQFISTKNNVTNGPVVLFYTNWDVSQVLYVRDFGIELSILSKGISSSDDIKEILGGKKHGISVGHNARLVWKHGKIINGYENTWPTIDKFYRGIHVHDD